MTQAELEKLHKDSARYLETTNHAVSEVIVPQIESFKNTYNKYLKELATAAGVISGAVTALLSSNINRVEWLAVLGFIFLVIVVVFSFWSLKKGIVESVLYIQYLKSLSQELTDFSHNVVRFSRGEITPEDFQKTELEFKGKYDKQRNDHRGVEITNKENEILLKMTKWYSEINILFMLFSVGIILVALSTSIPLFKTGHVHASIYREHNFQWKK